MFKKAVDLLLGGNPVFIRGKSPRRQHRVDCRIQSPSGLLCHLQGKAYDSRRIRSKFHRCAAAVVDPVDLTAFICDRPFSFQFLYPFFYVCKRLLCPVPVCSKRHISVHGKEIGLHRLLIYRPQRRTSREQQRSKKRQGQKSPPHKRIFCRAFPILRMEQHLSQPPPV